MKIKSITISKNALLDDDIIYKFGTTNLIHSVDNAKGKTSLLRLILYSLGFDIPATKGLSNFKNITTETTIETNEKTLIIRRLFRHITITEKDVGTALDYIVPRDELAIHSLIFGIDNHRILENLLGTFYIDQDKGWTLLNRGKAIGGISFNVEDLISGVTNTNIYDDKYKIKQIDAEITKLKILTNIANYQDIAKERTAERIDYDDANKLIRRKNEILQRLHDAKKELNEIKKIKKESALIPELIEKYSLQINHDGQIIPITKDNICNFSENDSYLTTIERHKLNEIYSIETELKKIEDSIEEKNKLLDIKPTLNTIENQLMDIQISEEAIEKALQAARKAKKELVERMNEKLANNEAVEFLYNIIKKYAKELGVSYYIGDAPKYVMTRELKSYSGKVLFHITFIFKLAYISLIKKYTGEVLPIIIDSPRSGEIVEKSAEKIIGIMRRDYSEHQLIVASVYNFNNLTLDTNIIELNHGVFNSLPE